MAIHVFVFFHSCCNPELQILQIFKQAYIHTHRNIKQVYCVHIIYIYVLPVRQTELFSRKCCQLTNLKIWNRLQKSGEHKGGPTDALKENRNVRLKLLCSLEWEDRVSGSIVERIPVWPKILPGMQTNSKELEKWKWELGEGDEEHSMWTFGVYLLILMLAKPFKVWRAYIVRYSQFKRFQKRQ